MSLTKNADSLTTALALLDAGLTPLPTVPGQKRPAITWREFAKRRPTRDEVESWYAADRARGVALLMGPTLLAVDVDTKSGGDPAPFVGTTPAVQHTPNKGFHFIYRLTGSADHVRPRTGVREGIDLRTRESIIVLAPTALRAADGEVRAYEFEAGGFEALLGGQLPDAMGIPAVRALLEEKHGGSDETGDGESGRRWVADALAHPESVHPGSQEETLAKLCWWCAGHLDYDIAHELLCDWVKRLPLSRPHEPWGPEHVESRLDRAFENREPKAGRVSGVVGVDDTKAGGGGIGQLAEAILALAGQRRTSDKRSIEVAVETITLGEFFTRTDVEERWLCREFPIPDQSVFLVAGASHVGKSLLMLDLAVSVATGADFLGSYKIESPGPVLLVIGEERKPTLRRRLNMFLDAKDWLRGYMEPEPEWYETDGGREEFGLVYRSVRPSAAQNIHLYFAGGFRLGDERTQDKLFARADELKPRLIVFDSFKDFVTEKLASEHMAGGAAHVHYFRRFRDELSCAVGVIHHAKRGGIKKDIAKERFFDPDEAIQGNHMFIASFDKRYILFPAGKIENDDGTTTMRAVVATKDKDESAVGPFLVEHRQGEPMARPMVESEDADVVGTAGATLRGDAIWTTARVIDAEEALQLVTDREEVDIDQLTEQLETTLITVIRQAGQATRNDVITGLKKLGIRKRRQAILDIITRLCGESRLNEEGGFLQVPGGSGSAGSEAYRGNGNYLEKEGERGSGSRPSMETGTGGTGTRVLHLGATGDAPQRPRRNQPKATPKPARERSRQ